MARDSMSIHRRSFTVVTPNYNMGRYLAETIESVLQNLQPGDQYFVIDGASQDESLSIIKSYEKHLSGWCSETDGGYADALHKGFAKAAGEYACWINSGDLLLHGALSFAADQLEDGQTDMIFGDDFYIDEEGRVIFKSSGRVRSLQDSMLFGGWTPLQDACFWKRSLYDRVGGINRELRFAADYDLFLRFALYGHCRYVPAVFSAFRRHHDQKSIAGALQYAEERERCRGSELERRRIRGMRRVWLEAFHRNALRLRLYASKVWRWHRELPTKKVKTLSVGAY